MKYIKLLYEFFWGILFGIFAINNSKLSSKCRKIMINTECYIDMLVYIENRKKFYAKRGSSLYHGTHILNRNGTFYLGSRSHLGAFSHVNVCYGNITICDNVAIGPSTKIISFSNHYKKGDLVINTYIQKDIYIGSNVFIGSNVTVLPGSRIKDNVVVGANSVVKGTLESDSIYAGSPIKFVKNIT